MAAYRGVFRTQSNIYNEDFFAKILDCYKLLTIVAKKAPLKMFDWVENRLLAKALSRESTLPENVDFVFEKMKRCHGT